MARAHRLHISLYVVRALLILHTQMNQVQKVVGKFGNQPILVRLLSAAVVFARQKVGEQRHYKSTHL